MSDAIGLEIERLLRQAAEEIRRDSHAGWGNTCEMAADEVDTMQARIEALEKDYMEEKIEGDRLQARIEALEAENKDLLAACEQKQEIINALKTELKLWLEEDGSPGCKAILRALEKE